MKNKLFSEIIIINLMISIYKLILLNKLFISP